MRRNNFVYTNKLLFFLYFFFNVAREERTRCILYRFARKFVFDISGKIIIERSDRFQSNRDKCYVSVVFERLGIIILTGILFCLLYSKTSFSVTFIVYIRKLCIDRTERKPRATLTRHVLEFVSFKRKFTLLEK